MPEPKTHLLIRADGGLQMGTGHLMRCLALAQEWRAQRGPVTFASATAAPAFEARLRAEGMAHEAIAETAGTEGDARATVRLAKRLEARWIACDGYQFGAEWIANDDVCIAHQSIVEFVAVATRPLASVRVHCRCCRNMRRSARRKSSFRSFQCSTLMSTCFAQPCVEWVRTSFPGSTRTSGPTPSVQGSMSCFQRTFSTAACTAAYMSAIVA